VTEVHPDLTEADVSLGKPCSIEVAATTVATFDAASLFYQQLSERAGRRPFRPPGQMSDPAGAFIADARQVLNLGLRRWPSKIVTVRKK
jgi:hypothetical protein